MVDTEEKGGMFKDQLYLQGAIEVLKKRKSINFMDLYCGKLNLVDCKWMAEKNLIKKEDICVPYFLKDINRYVQALDIIAETNFID